MSVEMKPGIWRSRCGELHAVDRFNKSERIWKWEESTSDRSWDDQGMWHASAGTFGSDLVQYIGPIELSPPPRVRSRPAPPVVSPVSTETAGEQLQRMRQRYNEMDREASIYSGLLAALDQAKSDLGERIRAMEKEYDL